MVSLDERKEVKIMKYMSELPMKEKVFDSIEELEKAEKEYQENQEKEKQALEVKKAEISAEKKEFAKKIEDAEIALEKAYSEYYIAKDKSKEIMKKAREEAGKLLEEAGNKISEASQNRYNAIAEFNEKFGVYSVSYTGKKAEEEFNKNRFWVDQLFNSASSLFNGIRWF